MSKRTIRKTKLSKKRNNPSLGYLSYHGDNHVPTSVEQIKFSKDSVVRNMISDLVNLKDELAHDKTNWFKIVGITDVARISDIGRSFGLHGFDVKDLLSDQQVAKVVAYDEITFILMPIFRFNSNDNSIDNFQVGFILGSDFVVSMQEVDDPLFEEVDKAIDENVTILRQNGSDFLLYVLLGSLHAMYLNTVMKIEDQLMDIEDQLVAQHNNSNLMSLLRARRVDYIKMKRAILSLREEYNNLLHNTNKLIDSNDIVYYNDLDDKLRTLLSNLEACHELLNSLLDLYYSNINTRMNEIMQRLTVVSTIFIPLTFMAGVWGMNFKFMPELSSPYGYLVAWGTFIGIGALAAYFLKRKKWF